MMRLAAVIFLVCGPTFSLTAQDAKHSAKPLVNWGSLDGVLSDNGLPTYWIIPSEAGLDCATTFTVFRSAPRSLLMKSTVPWANVVTGQYPVTKGTRQSARAFVKLAPESVGDVAMLFQYLDSTGKMCGDSRAVVLTPKEVTMDGPWGVLSTEGRADDFPSAVSFQLLLANRRGAISYWDDVDARSYPEQVPDNLLKNGDFEIAQGATTLDWQIATDNSNKVSLQPVIGNAKQGFFFAALSGEAKKATLMSVSLPIQPGKTYRMQGWHRANAGKGLFQLAFRAGNDRVALIQSKKTPTKDWSACEELVAAPADYRNATHVQIEYEVTDKFDIALDAVQLLAN